MNYTNYITDIAKVDKQDRFDAIISVLDENGIAYKEQKDGTHSGSVNNIVVSINDFVPDRIVIGAHYDNAPRTPGANDNAAACSILLNLVMALKDTSWPIDFVFFDCEEIGGVGSQLYLRTIGKNHISAMINLDMCGLGNNTLINFFNICQEELVEPLGNFFTQEVCNDFRSAGMLPFGDAYTFIYAELPTIYIISSTDHDIEWFRRFSDRLPLNPGDADFAKTMHMPSDTPDTINYEQVEKIYNMLLKVFLIP